MKTCTIKIGDIVITFLCPTYSWKTFISEQYQPFLSSHRPFYTVSISSLPSISKQRNLSVIKKQQGWFISRNDFVSQSTKTLIKTSLTIQKKKYTFDSWLRIYFTLIALKHQGMLLHASGIYNLNAGTFVFPGVSGKGKSSIIKILGKQYALSDELVFIYKKARSLYTSSTPFWGELKKGTGTIYSAPLQGLYFLKHAKHVEATLLDTKESLKKLLQTVLFFAKDTQSVQSLLKLSSQIIKKKPSYTLLFSLQNKREDVLNALQRNLSHVC